MQDEDLNQSDQERVDTKASKVCFVVGPIGEVGSATRRHADWLLRGIIIPTFAQNFPDVEVIRSDRITTPGMIDAQMISHLLDAELVIADMSERNPNAFYEMGIRHMTSLPIIHMFEKQTALPFDVASYRAIPFSTETIDDVDAAKAQLRAAVRDTMRADFKVDNPVIRARGEQKITKDATPEMKLVWEEIRALKSHVLREQQAIPAALGSLTPGPMPPEGQEFEGGQLTLSFEEPISENLTSGLGVALLRVGRAVWQLRAPHIVTIALFKPPKLERLIELTDRLNGIQPIKTVALGELNAVA